MPPKGGKGNARASRGTPRAKPEAAAKPNQAAQRRRAVRAVDHGVGDKRPLAIDESEYGPEHRNVAEILSNLGNTCGAPGDSARQWVLLERPPAIVEREFGCEQCTVAATLANLGNTYGDLGSHRHFR